MLADTRSRPSFLASTLLLPTIYCRHAFANLVTVDDRDSSLVWGGSWAPFFGQPEAEDGTLTWANDTGPTVTFAFTGVEVRVFGAFKPVGTWNIQSLYAIDGGSPTPFVPSRQVDQESFRQMFFDSGPLPLGKHTLKVTNLGVQLWLDYFLYDDGGDGAPNATLSLLSTDHTGGATTTATRPSSPSAALITTSSSISSTRDASGGSISSTNSEVATSSLRSAASLATSPWSTPAVPPFVAPTPSQSSSLPLSLSPNATATPRGSETPQQANTHGHGMPRAALVGLSVGTVVITGVVLLVILLRRRRRHCRRTEAQLRASQNPLSSLTASSLSLAVHPDRDRASHSTTPSSDTLGVGDGGEVGYCSFSQWLQQAAEKRSMELDGRVSVEGGPHDLAADARSVEDAASGKSTPPPPYREFEDGVL
ncbi:hypothetical protein V8D89_000915 [Ganoderma adspersum]